MQKSVPLPNPLPVGEGMYGHRALMLNLGTAPVNPLSHWERVRERVKPTILSLLILILIPSLSLADNPAKAARWYKVYWNKLYIADFKAELSNTDITVRIDSFGTVKAISKYSNYSYTKFHKDNDKYIPEIFNSSLNQRQGKKDVNIKYDNNLITEEAVTPPDNRAKRPAVTEELKKDTYNPLIAALIARDKIRAALTNGKETFSFNIYDGRRLSKLEFNVNGKESTKIYGKELNLVKITFKRIALEGFTHNELNRMKGEEPDFTIYLGEKDLLPIKADAVAPLGKAYFTLEKECESIRTCN